MLANYEEKKQKALENWVDTKIPNYYILIDKECKDCKELTTWWKVAANK